MGKVCSYIELEKKVLDLKNQVSYIQEELSGLINTCQALINKFSIESDNYTRKCCASFSDIKSLMLVCGKNEIECLASCAVIDFSIKEYQEHLQGILGIGDIGDIKMAFGLKIKLVNGCNP